MKYILVYGDIQSGFDFIGPFDTSAEAGEFAEKDAPDDWAVVPLFTPEGT
jgi:hypothetical protein